MLDDIEDLDTKLAKGPVVNKDFLKNLTIEGKKNAIKKALTFGLEANMETWLKTKLTADEIGQAQL